MSCIVKCAQCGAEAMVSSPYDDNTNEPVTCPECDWTTSKWTCEYIREADADGGN